MADKFYSGEKFGKWTIIKKTKDKRKKTAWLCECECGNTRIIPTYNLEHGTSTSCGCDHSMKMKARLAKKYPLPSYESDRIRRIHHAMISRCHNKNSSDYYKYGKRGVYVCNEWKESYYEFRKWALANGYSDNLSIDRIDNNGPYKQSNCQWITTAENNAPNKRRLRTGSKTGVNGVNNRGNTYCATLCINGNRYIKCGFKTIKDAEACRKEFENLYL